MKWIRVFKIDSVFTCVATIATWQYLLDNQIHLSNLLVSFLLSTGIYAANSLGDLKKDPVIQPEHLQLPLDTPEPSVP